MARAHPGGSPAGGGGGIWGRKAPCRRRCHQPEAVGANPWPDPSYFEAQPPVAVAACVTPFSFR